MKNIFTKIAASAGTAATLSMAIAMGASNPAQAVTFKYSFQTNTGFSGIGQFSYDETTAPAVISESGPGPTDFLDSLSLSVFDPAGNLLSRGSKVVNGQSTSDFLEFEFNTQTQALRVLDTSTDVNGNGFSYFITNAFDSNNQPVPPGSTDFNLFSFNTNTNPGTATFLGSTPSIVVTPTTTPEPASILGLLALGAIGAGSTLKNRKQA